MSDEYSKVVGALSVISPDVDRDTWVTIGMSVKAALGDGGFAAWDEWASRGETYKAESAKATWRSISGAGGVGPGTLFHLAKERGWRGEPIVYDEAQEAERRRRRAAEAKREAEAKARRQARAATDARELIGRSKLGDHAYLARKGFPREQGLIAHVDAEAWRALGFRRVDPPEHPRQLVIPMRDVETGAVVSAQLIDTKGGKQFIPGGKSRRTAFPLGRGPEKWLVEGYATGLSVRAALALLCRQATVLVTFSAANLKAVAEVVEGRRFVVADHDPAKANGAEGDGPMYARQTGLPMWMPAEAGTDANDFHQSAGLQALANELRRLLRQ